MLYSNYTKVLVTNYNKSKIEKQFGDKLNIEIDEYLKIPVDILPDGSGYTIEAVCNFCEKVYNTEWRKYLKIENKSEKHCCDSKECVNRKRKETSLKKWGVDNPMKSTKVKEKLEKSILDKWGVRHYSKTDDFKEKIKETSLEKWGVDHYSKTDEFKEKIKETSLEKWGVDNPSKSEKVKKKIKETFLEKWGVDKRIESNISLCTVCNPIGDSQSIKEKELYEYIKSIYNGEIIQSWRDGLEIDVYLPNLKLGFEFNGLYWHSDKWKDKNYHLDKTKYFNEREIRIIHIWEDRWMSKNKIIKSQIRNWLNLTENKIFARKCYVREILDSKIVTKFLEENHIQGKVASCLKLGLYYGDELVSLMTFDRYEGRKKIEDGGWNINRFCNRIDYNIIGGASKLFKYFLNNYSINRVISYADRDWSDGNLYKKLGFKKVSSSDPDYKYIIEGVRVHKSRFRKSNTGISEKYLKLLKIWDCGKIKWEFII